ncbi:hypothetical protein [Halorarum salinum]|uniref:Uncharacterized protein n=1 Tax=Halorarum salinum TaxID=2743089 RepID=A0A7D5LBS0_9EURY|nr:hypothetical protein [Halobaculum salinum]QLG62209.1 hypothetical protein HUG12_10890 [Halobaculum salinum]
MPDSFRWRLTGRRDQLLVDLEERTVQNTKAKALDDAVRAYLRLVGGNAVEPGRGAFGDLLATADERGGLSAAEIAEILAVDELPVQYEPATWSIGNDEE